MWARNVEKVLAQIMSAIVYHRHGDSSVEKRSPHSQLPWTRQCELTCASRHKVWREENMSPITEDNERSDSMYPQDTGLDSPARRPPPLGPLWPSVWVQGSVRTDHHCFGGLNPPNRGPYQVFSTLWHLSVCHPWPTLTERSGLL